MSWFALIKAELSAFLANPAAALTVFGGVIFYSFLYPLPYAQQTPHEQLISVVNLDKSLTSYQLERMVDATPQVQIVTRHSSIKEAEQAFYSRDISGFIVIPEHFYKNLLLGKSPVLAYAGDASYFLVYGTILEGLAKAGGTLAAQVKVSKLVLQGVPLALASQQYTAVKLNMKPSYNSRMGYVYYVVPAVFILILQQTLAMATGLMVSTQRHHQGYWLTVPVWRLMTVRCVVFIAIYYVLSLFYFGASFSFYGINRLAAIPDLLTLLLPFLLASSLCGISLGAILPRRELVTVVVLISSMPLVFSAGFIWPLEVIPDLIVWGSQLFPSTAAIPGFLKLNQMGAQWWQIADQWRLLWALCLLWGGLAYWTLKRRVDEHQSLQ